MKFSIKDFFSKCDQIRSFHGELHFLCSVTVELRILSSMKYGAYSQCLKNVMKTFNNHCKLECEREPANFLKVDIKKNTLFYFAPTHLFCKRTRNYRPLCFMWWESQVHLFHVVSWDQTLLGIQTTKFSFLIMVFRLSIFTYSYLILTYICQSLCKHTICFYGSTRVGSRKQCIITCLINYLFFILYINPVHVTGLFFHATRKHQKTSEVLWCFQQSIERD